MINFGEIAAKDVSLLGIALFDVVCLLLVGSIASQVFIQRLIVGDWGVQTVDMLNRYQRLLPFDQITSYQRTAGGDWILVEGDQVYPIPRIDKQEFHAVIAQHCPRALHAKLWKSGQLPPSDDFSGLSAFDLNLWLVSLVGAAVVSGMFAFLAHLFALIYFASYVLQTAYDLKNVLGRIALTSEGIEIKWPWETRFVGWTELTAVFCETSPLGKWSYFVVTAPGRSITLPTHLFSDMEVRRKFFYSIPDQTRCVNFEKMRFRPRGRKKRQTSTEESFSPEPQFSL